MPATSGKVLPFFARREELGLSTFSEAYWSAILSCMGSSRFNEAQPVRIAPKGTGLTFLQGFWNNIADAGRELLDMGNKRARMDIGEICKDLLSQKGEALGTALARELVVRYESLTPGEKTSFFRMLRSDFDVDHAAVREAIAAYQAEPTTENAQVLSKTSEGRRCQLLYAINRAPGGTSSVLRMREDLQKLLADQPDLAPVDADFLTTLSVWFNRGFLELQHIDWKTPAKILEKLIDYEAVHAIRGWDDLRRRLEADRRCYGFFHPALPDDPLIFLEVALTSGLASSIQDLLDDKRQPGDPAQADTAMFYSISNCKEGLRGISFGNFLIKQVVSDIQAELPRLKTFATLSPIPEFRRWLSGIQASGDFPSGFTMEDRRALACLDRENWHTNPELTQKLERRLLYLCAHYLLNVKHNNHPIDPVARFHLGNGARIERINWLGDVSAQGIEESAGLMANYLYDTHRIERYHEVYANSGMITCSRGVRTLISRSS